MYQVRGSSLDQVFNRQVAVTHCYKQTDKLAAKSVLAKLKGYTNVKKAPSKHTRIAR